jgi:hypothetical protein
VSTDRIQHSKEEWDRIEAENKAEDEAFAKRRAQREIVAAGSGYIFRDLYGIHPDEQIQVQESVDRINQRFRELFGLRRKAIELVFEIGAELCELKENKVPGKWTEFCKAKFPTIHQRSLEDYMKLARERPWLESKYVKIESDSFFEVCPTMKLMLGDLQERNRDQRATQGKPPIRHRSETKEKHASRSTPEPQKEPLTDVDAKVVSSSDSKNGSERLSPPPSLVPAPNLERPTGDPPAVNSEPEEADPEPEKHDQKASEAAVEQNQLDNETQAARYFTDELKAAAPRLWERLCPECKTVLIGEEH